MPQSNNASSGSHRVFLRLEGNCQHGKFWRGMWPPYHSKRCNARTESKIMNSGDDPEQVSANSVAPSHKSCSFAATRLSARQELKSRGFTDSMG